MRFNLIASGSEGNSLVIKGKSTNILIDFGISKKRVNEGLFSLSLSFDDIDAFLITHLHSDHAKGIKYAPVEKIYSGDPFIPEIDKPIREENILKDFQKIQIGEFSITSLPVSHDVKNYAFVVDDGNEKLCYLTDTGIVPEKDFPYLNNLNYYIFESNYNTKLLLNSGRPKQLIKRITSSKGHMSNKESAYYLTTLLGENTKEIVLSHLSRECNDKNLAIDTFKEVSSSILGYVPDIKIKASTFTEMIFGGEDDY